MADNTINRDRPPRGSDGIDDILEEYPEAEGGKPGGPAEQEPTKPTAEDVDDGVRIGKNMRMRPTYSQWLYKLATERTMASSGKKVYEADVLDEALTEYFQKHGLLD